MNNEASSDCVCVAWCKEAVESSVEAVALFVTPNLKSTELLIRVTTESKVHFE